MSETEKVRREHRIPKEPRSSFPQCWVLWYSWRRIVFFTPKVRLRALQVVVSTLPTRQWLVGVNVYRDDDDDLVVMLGLGVLDIEVNVMHFLPESYWTDRLTEADRKSDVA